MTKSKTINGVTIQVTSKKKRTLYLPNSMTGIELKQWIKNNKKKGDKK